MFKSGKPHQPLLKIAAMRLAGPAPSASLKTHGLLARSRLGADCLPLAMASGHQARSCVSLCLSLCFMLLMPLMLHTMRIQFV